MVTSRGQWRTRAHHNPVLPTDHPTYHAPVRHSTPVTTTGTALRGNSTYHPRDTTRPAAATHHPALNGEALHEPAYPRATNLRPAHTSDDEASPPSAPHRLDPATSQPVPRDDSHDPRHEASYHVQVAAGSSHPSQPHLPIHADSCARGTRPTSLTTPISARRNHSTGRVKNLLYTEVHA